MQMAKHLVRNTMIVGIALVASVRGVAQGQTLPGTDRKPRALTEAATDIANRPSIFTMSYAHLDTEWNWDYVATIGQYLPKTMHENFDLFAKYPDYIFNFSGANRYRLMKEYYPADYDKLKGYVAAGRWFPAGSSMEEGDVNAPSSEGILREFLYGNDYFRTEFGKASQEYMLPDCFGFPWSLPTLLAHAGITGFSTQKLTWGSSVPEQPSTPYAEGARGIPFNYGIWRGPDGKGVILAANPGTYGGKLNADWSTGQQLDNSIPGGRMPQQTWNARLQEDKQKLGFVTDYHYLGTGDTGGSPGEPTVRLLQEAIDKPSPTVKIISSNADQFFLAFTADQIKRLPVYSGEMELTNHSAGSLTSEAYIKRWIRRNETLADAAEKASVAAMWLGRRAYPKDRLNAAWTLAMGDHFHDIGAGTASVRAYEYAWNDQVITLNQFASVLTSATEAVSGALNTQVQGTPIVVYNPLSIEREDMVEATVPVVGGAPKGVHVFNPAGAEVPSQLESMSGNTAVVLFAATVPSAGYGVYDIRLSTTATPARSASPLKVTTSSLENARYRVAIDAAGDVSSIFDKKVNKELLSAPARLAFVSGTPSQWPAWNMDFDDAIRPPRSYLGGPVQRTVSENGSARVAVTIERSEGASKFVQTIRLSAGDAGNRVEFSNSIDWRMDSTVVKAVFPLTATNDTATYNLGVGTIRRPTMYDRKFEVPTHQWIDLTDKSGSFGATVLTDAKNGSDKPDANTLRLSLIYSPGIPGGVTGGYSYQAWQDWGHHDILYGFSGHSGDFRDGQTDWQGMRLNEPLIAFVAPKHAGALGKTFSLMRVSNARVQVMAVKRAEQSDEIIVRLNELDGRAQQNVRVSFAAPITSAREVNGQEQPLGAATVTGGALVTSFTPFAIHTFAIKVGPAPAAARAAESASQAVTLTYDRAVASRDSTTSVGGFDSQGRALPAEMLLTNIPYAGIAFTLPQAREGVLNAVSAHGQTIALPAGYTRVYLLAASADGDQRVSMRVGDKSSDLTIEDWGGFVGQWYQRVMKRIEAPPPTPEEIVRAQQQQVRQDSIRRARIDSVQRAGGDTMAVVNGRGGGGRGGRGGGNQGPRMVSVLDSLNTAFIKEAPIAWYASHRHTAAGANEIYSYSYLFAYALDIPAGATTLTLPNNENVCILAVTVSKERGDVRPAQALYDTFKKE